ncbi:hypothetical protein BGX34_011336 [Mortierella sp. NVP85]|nr:hypothetical protein BGX34_011336 [Mortierella sp. NVP85]
MPLTNPLEMLEIMDQVALYLEDEDLTRCVCVSKSWRDIFLPHRWRVVVRGFMVDFLVTDYFGPDRDDMYNHRHLIQDLSLIGEIAGLDEYIYPNLRDLQIDLAEAANASSDRVSMDLFKMAPLLVNLSLGSVEVAPAIWESLAAHPHIRKLGLNNVRIKAVDALGFWEACRRLESLEMDYVTIEGGGVPRDLVFDRLCNLAMRITDKMDEAKQMDLILQSPNLRCLDWNVGPFKSSNGGTLIHHPIRNHHWPHFNKLHMSCHLSDADLASILGGIGNIVDLHLSHCLSGLQAPMALSLHFNTLVKVDLGVCTWADSSMILDILCSCPRLEVLQAKDVFAKDIAEHGPWVCQQLRKLKLCFRVEESEQDLQRLIFERLSALVQLEELIMWLSMSDNAYGVLKFRLECGLGLLASLQQLTTLRFFRDSASEYVPQLGMDEVTWMVDNWKKLKSIKGRLNSDQLIESQLQRTIECHDIEIWLT